MRAILVGDIHLSDRPPSVRTDTYTDDILAKLAFAVAQASERADTLVLLGDVFHIKTPSKTSHRLVTRTAEVLEAYRGQVLIVPGNHDLSQDRLDSLPSQPLGTLALSPNITLLDGLDQVTGIYAIPYLDDHAEFLRRVGADGDFDLIVTHQSIFPPGQHPPYPHVTAGEVAAWTRGTPLAYGHIHDPHGFYQVNDTWFCNNGAISRGSLHEETLKRHPKITLFDSDLDGCPFESIDVPHRPAEDVFRLAQHVEKVATEQRLDTFMESVGRVDLAVLSLEEVVAHAATSGLSAAAQAELSDIVATAVHG